MGEGVELHVIGNSETLISLDMALERYAGFDPVKGATAAAIRAIASVSIELEDLIANDAPGLPRHDDGRKSLSQIAGDLFTKALSTAPVAAIDIGELDVASPLDRRAPIAVAIEPLDGSSNVDTNIPAGTIFSLLPADTPADADVDMSTLQPGHRQLAAGFVIYGAQTCLVLTLGEGTAIYRLDRQNGAYMLAQSDVRIAADSSDYAINASNYRHWDKPTQAYVDDNVAGIEGPRGRNFNMRWTGSLVAEAYRILIRGGIFLKPGERRGSDAQGKTRLLSQANPIAMLVEQAGGLATDGEDRILDIEPIDRQHAVPLVFGSSAKVERVRAFHDGTLPLGERSPLFGHRGLFRH